MSKHKDFPKSDTFLSVDEAVKIKCQYCDIADICHRRPLKEKYEATGLVTRCTMTPNRPGENRKKRKKAKKKK